MKRISALIFAIMLVIFFSLSAFSSKINLDGLDDGWEWSNAETISLFADGSHNNINIAYIKYYVDFDSYDIWLLFQLHDSKLEVSDEDVRIIIYTPDEEIVVNPSAEYVLDNRDKYYVETNSVFNGARGVTSEIRLGVKNGIPDEYKLRFQIVDSEGNKSDIRDVTIKNNIETTTVASEPETTEKKVTTTKKTETTTKKERTTKEKTTKMRTTKATTVKITTTKAPKTTKAKTTKAPKTAKAETSKSAKTTKPISSVAEQSIIQNTSAIACETTLPTETTTAPVSEALSASEKYKTVIFASGAVALILIASLSVMNANKKKEE